MVRNKTEIGRSMIEMIGVLAIVAVLTIGGIIGFDRAAAVLRINDFKDQVTTLVANVRSMYFSKDNYSSLSNKTLITAGFIPERYIGENKVDIINRNNGSVLIGPAATYLHESGAFILIQNGLDAFTCREIIAISWGADISSGLLGMAVKNDGDMALGETGLEAIDIVTNGETFHPIDLPQAMLTDTYETCNCGNVNLCSIAWKYL